MNPTVTKNIETAQAWLREKVFPLWKEKGIDSYTGSFVEALSLEGEPLDKPRRGMVQARQIYSFHTGMNLGCCPEETARNIIDDGVDSMLKNYPLESGAFIHSVNPDGTPNNTELPLYTQAFALFGLANAYVVSPEAKLKDHAIAVLDYLQKERRASGGGYTEIENGEAVLRSNPHMHLLEAALAWRKTDPDPRWKELSEEVLDLCLDKFIDPLTGGLCEIFSEGWEPVRTDGHFYFEPGHHYEWSWLMMVFEEISGRDLSETRNKLFRLAEDVGLSPKGNAIDEVWSNGEAKKTSSRFWPQGERLKAAVRMGSHAPQADRTALALAADTAFEALSRFLETPTPGLWRDTLLESGEFREEPAKASSLYHIINAFEEYILLRPNF